MPQRNNSVADSSKTKANKTGENMRQLDMFNKEANEQTQGQDNQAARDKSATVAEQVQSCDHITAIKKKKTSRKTTAAKLMALLEKQEYRCALSGHKLTVKTASLDHVVPVSEGGSDDIDNLQWVHNAINRAKGTMSQQSFTLMCRRVAQYQS